METPTPAQVAARPVLARACSTYYQLVIETPVESPERAAWVDKYCGQASLLVDLYPADAVRAARRQAIETTGVMLTQDTHPHDVLSYYQTFLDALTGELPADLEQARFGLLGALAALVRFARTLPDPSVERDTVRHAIREVSNALVRIYPTAAVDAAQQHALRTLEIRPPGTDRVEISGETVELYAAELCKSFLVHESEAPPTDG